MQLAIKHAYEHIDNIDELIISFDDGYSFFSDNNSDIAAHYPVMSDLVPRIKKLYPHARVFAASDFEYTHDEVLGWLRQQYLILNMHNIIDGDEWVVMGGDVILKNKKVFKEDDSVIMYTDDFDYYPPYFHFINHATGIVKDKQPSYMCHFYLQQREVLQGLEDFLIAKHGLPLVPLFKQFHRPLLETIYAYPKVPPLADNELYGLFATEILKKNILTPKYNLQTLPPEKFVDAYYRKTIDIEIGGSDDLPISFYESHGIEYQLDLADALKYNNR